MTTVPSPAATAAATRLFPFRGTGRITLIARRRPLVLGLFCTGRHGNGGRGNGRVRDGPLSNGMRRDGLLRPLFATAAPTAAPAAAAAPAAPAASFVTFVHRAGRFAHRLVRLLDIDDILGLLRRRSLLNRLGRHWRENGGRFVFRLPVIVLFHRFLGALDLVKPVFTIVLAGSLIGGRSVPGGASPASTVVAPSPATVLVPPAPALRRSKLIVRAHPERLDENKPLAIVEQLHLHFVQTQQRIVADDDPFAGILLHVRQLRTLLVQQV